MLIGGVRLHARRPLRDAVLAALGTLCAGAAFAQAPVAPRQTDADEYTRYELLAPETAQFRILYEVTATTAGATAYFNPIRKGSEASREAVYDRLTGQPLGFEVVTGVQARAEGLPGADPDTSYIKARLARPVPADGETRLLIEKTYKDPKSYFREGETIVFSRPLGIKRNAVVLPPGYEVIGCNVPSQLLSEADGRILISFMNVLPGEAPLVLKARRVQP